MKIKDTIELYSAAAGGQSGGSSLINYPGSPADEANRPTIKDKARERLVRPFASPDVDAGQSTNETGQTDSAAFTGKKYRVQDKLYGHYIGEYDTKAEAEKASIARPYSRILEAPDWHNIQKVRDKSIKEASRLNDDTK